MVHDPFGGVEFALEFAHRNLVACGGSLLDALLELSGILFEAGEHTFRLLAIDGKHHIGGSLKI